MKKLLVLLLTLFSVIFLFSCSFESITGNGGNNKEDLVQKAYDEVFAELDLVHVTSDLVFPAKVGDVTIRYESSNPTVISHEGKVTRQSEDVTVNIFVTFTYEGKDEIRRVTFVVLAKEEGQSEDTFAVTLVQSANGSVSANVADLTKVTKGSSVEFTVTPNQGYEVEQVKINDQVSNTAVVNGKFSLTINANTKVEVTFKQTQSQQQIVADTLTVANLGGDTSSNGYVDWTKAMSSGAEYFGHTGGWKDGLIQIRWNTSDTAKQDAALLVSKSIGKVQKIEFTVNEKTDSRNKIQVYGFNTKYETVSAFLTAVKGGLTPLAEVQCTGTSVSYTFTGDYQYFAIKSEGYTIYLDAIKVTWVTDGSYNPGTPDTPTTEDKYIVTLVQSTGGTLSTNAVLTNVAAGTKIEFSVAANNGYHATGVKVNGSLTNTAITNNKFTLIINANTRVEVEFEKDQSGQGDTPVQEGALVIDMEEYASENGWVAANENDSAAAYSVVELDEITISTVAGSNNGKYYAVDSYNSEATWRLYSSESATLTFESERKIESVKIYFFNNNGGYFAADDGSTYSSGDLITVNDNSITLTVAGSSGTKKGQARIYKFEIVLEGGVEVVESDLDKAFEDFESDLENVNATLTHSGNNGYTGGYKLTESIDGDKVYVKEEYTDAYGDKATDYTYFYYDDNDVFHFIFMNFDEWTGEELGYEDISENSSEFDYYYYLYTYYDEYPLLLITKDQLEKIGTNKYQVKADLVNDLAKEIIGDYDDEGHQYTDEYGDKYDYEALEVFTSIVVELKNDKIYRITFTSSFEEKVSWIEDDEEENYSGTLKYVFVFTGHGSQTVNLPQATLHQDPYEILDVFEMENGTDVSLSEVYVNGFNEAEKVIYVCDSNGSIAVNYTRIDFELIVGDCLDITGSVKKTGSLVEIDATSISSYGDTNLMQTLQISSFDDRDYTFAGEFIDLDYATIKTLDVDNLDVSLETVDGDTVKLVFLDSEKELVTRLFADLEVECVVNLKGVAVSLDSEGKFTLKLVDNATEVEGANGLSVSIDYVEMNIGSSLTNALADLKVYLYTNGVKEELDSENYELEQNDFDETKPNTYLITVKSGDYEAQISVRVKYLEGTSAFRETNGRGIEFASQRYGTTSGLASTGDVNILVIPVSFTGQSYSNDYESIIRAGFEGDSEATGWESLASYYEKSSYGKLHFNVEITPVYASGLQYRSDERYEDDEYGKYPYIDYKILDEAIAYFVDDYDYTQYDSNHDGTIDTVYLIYLAPYQTGDDTELWWAYNYQFYGDNSGEKTEYDGKTLDYYLWMSINFFEDQISGTNVSINAETVIHETGHALGLDDYYDTNYTGNGGFGGGTMMDYNVGDHDPYAKAILGWINPWIVLDTDASIDLGEYETTGDAIFIAKDYDGMYFGEFYIIDYYTPTGLNELENGNYGLPSISGIRIIHVNATPKKNISKGTGVWDLTEASNSDKNNKLIYVVEADGNGDITNGEEMSNSDLFQAGDVLEGLKWYDGTSCGFTIRVNNITEGKWNIVIDFE